MILTAQTSIRPESHLFPTVYLVEKMRSVRGGKKSHLLISASSSEAISKNHVHTLSVHLLWLKHLESRLKKKKKKEASFWKTARPTLTPRSLLSGAETTAWKWEEIRGLIIRLFQDKKRRETATATSHFWAPLSQVANLTHMHWKGSGAF